MMQHRFSADLIVTVDDFHSCGWKEALREIAADDVGYSSLWQTLSKAAQKASEENRQSHAKVLWLLADACSMMLRPGSLNEPFKPFAVFEGRRSAIPDDFNATELTFFSDIVESVDHPLLKSRLADLLWMMVKPRNANHARMAVDEYRCMSLEPQLWVRGGRECWGRAFKLVFMLKAGAGSRLDEMRGQVIDRLMRTTLEEKFFGVSLARLLRENRLAKSDGIAIAEKLEALANAFDEKSDVLGARAFFEESACWFHWIGDPVRCVEMTAAHAETYVKEADFQTASDSPSSMIANSLYEKAIQIYRDIPARLRPAHSVDQCIAELRKKQSTSGEHALGEMAVIRSPSMDISEIVVKVREAVSGKSALDALRSVANIHDGEQVDSLRQRIMDQIAEFPMQWLFDCTMFSRDGRVIAKRPTINIAATVLSESDEKAIHAGMVQDYTTFLGFTVHGYILPALKVLQQEHRLREVDFIELCRHSPIVPSGRETLFGKALYAGYENDFTIALHLLVPQIEHMVRVHLKRAGATTTNLDRDGIENENGLSTLMELPEVEMTFGKDIAFELTALFCDAFGPNLRNELAHGLLDQGSSESPTAIYAWWLGLKLVFNTWWNKRAVAMDGAGEAA